MVAHEKRNSAQLFCAVPTRNDLALSSLIFSAQPTQKLEYPLQCGYTFLQCGYTVFRCGYALFDKNPKKIRPSP